MMERTAAQSAALAQELRNVMQQAEKLVIALSEDREAAMVELRERVSFALAEGKKHLEQFEEQARQSASAAADAASSALDCASDALDDYVQENPWTTVGVGAAIGLILGSWLASGPRE
jgi:ElaB/YqjD/DUF883 family membrane-anchored ribosome-binding protein